MLARVLQRLHIGALIGVQSRARQQIRHAQHAVQWRAQLVTQGRQEAVVDTLSGSGRLADGLFPHAATLDRAV